MDFVTVELDIKADGSVVATPNPVQVATGEVLRIHIRSNQSEKPKARITFKGGPLGPFGERDSGSDGDASPCNGPTHGVTWPEGGTEGRVTVEIHGSPVTGSVTILVHPVVRSKPATGGACVVNNYYFCHCCEGAHRPA
jgi:hypothetical protein